MPSRRHISAKNKKKTDPKKSAVKKAKVRSKKSKPKTTFPEPLKGVSLLELYKENKEKISPIILLSGIFICIYIGLSLLSYSSTHDQALDLEHSQNIGGILGAYIAHHLFHLLGYGAWSIVALGGTFAWKLAGRSLGGIGRTLGWLGLLWMFLEQLHICLG